jgi:hypothetical protein
MPDSGKTARFLLVLCMLAICSNRSIDAAGQKDAVTPKTTCKFSKAQIVENPLNCADIRSIEEWKKIWGNPVTSDTVIGPPEIEGDSYHVMWIYLNYAFGQAIFIRETDQTKTIFTTVHMVRPCKDCLKCGIAIGDSVSKITRILSTPDSIGADTLLNYTSKGAELKFLVAEDRVKEILYLPFWD